MNAQACLLWFGKLASKLQTVLQLECSVEARPMHVQIVIDDTRYIALGDANGPIGFDGINARGEVLSTGWEGTHYVGDDVDACVDELLPALRTCIDKVKAS